MNKQELDAIRAIYEAASPGSWEATDVNNRYYVFLAIGERYVDFRGSSGQRKRDDMHNAVFCAVAHEKIPALLDALEAAEGRAAQAEAERDALADQLAGNTFRCPDDQKPETCGGHGNCATCWRAWAREQVNK